ncbi:hypothetical protein ABEB36_001199 [Hypothenemus hampei]|uniref:Sialin n=1 Tax=Hypothenemus hampei TaxID=57062 RepID=A0ABD1FGC5_HYPHA
MCITAREKTWKIWTQRRFVLTFLVFCGYFNIYSLRANMSVGIVAMISDRYTTLENGTEINLGPEFEWSNIIQGYILSAFFYGYITTQLLGGFLGKRFGGKLIFGLGIATTALITLVTPWLVQWSAYALLSARVLMGILEGVTFSSLYCMWAKWVPPQERGRLVTLANCGSYWGAVFSMMFFGWLAEIAGWRSIFWFSGGLGLVWFIIWNYIVTESPINDPKISQRELNYIETSLNSSLNSVKSEKISSIPWKNLLLSKPAWALNVGLFCETWGFNTLLTLLPKYFKDVFQFEVSKSGLYSALPYVAVAIFMPISGQLIDKVVSKEWLSLITARKSFVSIGFLSQMGFMLGAAFWDSTAGTVFCLTMAVGLGAFALGSLSIYALDIAPAHAGLVFGIANTWGTVPGIISPIIAGYIVSTDNPTAEQWRIIFYITSSLYLFGTVIFTWFAKGNRQSWDMDMEYREERFSDTISIETKIVQD